MSNGNQNQGNQNRPGGSGPAHGGQATPAVRLDPGEIVIELGDDRGRQIYFQPINETFRGKWDNNLMRGQQASNAPGLAEMPTIPGICVALDVQRGRGRAFDPLALPKNATLLAEISGKYLSATKVEGGPMEEKVHENLRPSQIKTWLWFMLNLVEGKKAELLQGTLPKRAEIRQLAGKIRIGSPNSAAWENGMQTIEDMEARMAVVD